MGLVRYGTVDVDYFRPGTGGMLAFGRFRVEDETSGLRVLVAALKYHVAYIEALSLLGRVTCILSWG